MKKLILFLLCVPCLVYSQLRLHQWNNSYYNKYNYSTFQNLSIIHKEIDLKNIDYELFSAAIFYATNIERVKYGRNVFRHSLSLEKAAQGHSKDMVTHNFYSHTSPVNGKRSMSDRLRIVGISSSYSAENIHNDNLSNPTYWTFASALVKDWMDSPGHKANILNSRLTYLGCGVYVSSQTSAYGQVWVKSTQNFSSSGGSGVTINNTNIRNNTTRVPYKPTPKKDKPYKFLIKIGTSIYADISRLEEGDNIFDFSGITIDNRLNSVLFGYRKGLSSSNAKFSNSGRDMNRGNIYGLLYNYGTLSGVSYDNLNALDIDFKELHLVYSWQEFFRISYGHGTYMRDEIFSNILSNNDYKIISSGVNLRFGRITTDFNISLLSDDNFQSVYNRFDIGLGLNLYLIK